MASYTCRRCSRTFSDLRNAQPESAFVPPAGEYIDPHIADDMASRKGMTNLAPRDIPAGETAAQGYFLVMIDGTLHEFPGSGQ